jgi:hypothetical protein
MATSKSTVLGVRLDHERRAWIEAEAVRRGLSVRGLIEEMIDGARTAEMADADRAIAGLGSATPGPGAGHHPSEASLAAPLHSDAATAGASGVNTPPPRSFLDETSGSPHRPGLGSVRSLPGDLLRGGCTLTASLIEKGGLYAANRLGVCPLVRGWAERSV